MSITQGSTEPLEIELACDVDSADALDVSTPAAHGDVTFDAAELTATYTPSSPAQDDSFTFTATVADETSAPAVVTIDAVPPAPVCTLQDVEVAEGSTEAVTIELDCTGPVDDLDEVVAPVHGSVVLSPPAQPGEAPTARYTPDPAGAPVQADSFSYRAENQGGFSADAAVTLTVPPAPACVDVALHTLGPFEGQAELACTGEVDAMTITQVPANGMLYDADGDALPAAAVDLPLTDEGDGASSIVRFIAAHGFSGTNTFRYVASNGPSTSASATGTITVHDMGGGGGGGGGEPGFEFSTPGVDFPSEVVSAPSAPPPSLRPIGSARVGGNGNIPRFGRSARLNASRGRVRASRKGAVKLRVRNGNSFTVRSTVTARAIRGKRGQGRRVAKRLRLGPRKVTLRPKSTVTVTLRLDRGQRRLLRRVRKVKMRVRITARDGAGVARTGRSKITLRAPAKR